MDTIEHVLDILMQIMDLIMEIIALHRITLHHTAMQHSTIHYIRTDAQPDLFVEPVLNQPSEHKLPELGGEDDKRPETE